MRSFVCALFLAALSTAPAAHAQSAPPSVNQRMTGPTSGSDAYMGVSLGQLIVALGLTLKGAPPQNLDDIRLLHSRQTAEAPALRPEPRATAPGVPATVPGNAPPSP